MIAKSPVREPPEEVLYLESCSLPLDVFFRNINANKIEIPFTKLFHQIMLSSLIKIEWQDVILVAAENTSWGYDNLTIPERRAIWDRV